MASIRYVLSGAFIALAAGAALSSAALAQDRWDWSRGGPEDRGVYRLYGSGVRMLEPELRETRRGQAFVLRNFDGNNNGRIEPREARAANAAFLNAAGAGRRHFDWERRGALAAPPRAPGGWDRQRMRDYHFREGRYGATFTLQDVLFQTGSATLRPGVENQLRPLADYLSANPRVQVRVDGYTDAVGSDASNLTLSRNRARAVAAALSAMNVEPSRLLAAGYGKADPVASNNTTEGRQLNRRVEVTLVGQKAAAFN